MRVQALGHAGLRVEVGDTTLVCDPWFSPEGAFQGSWHQFPANDSQLEVALDEPTAVVISHEHMDHVDPWFLSHLPANVPVICPRYPSPALPRKIMLGGVRPIIEVDPWVPHAIGDTELFFVSEESPMNHDSAMVIAGDDSTLLNMNDARLTSGQIRQIERQTEGAIDLLFLQAAGASWFPICYEYDVTRKRTLAISKREAKLHYVERMMALTRARVSFPFAGPPAFLDDDLRWINSQMGPEGIFPDQAQVLAWLADEGAGPAELLMPGDTWDDVRSLVLRNPEWSDFSFEGSDGYLDEYAETRRAHIAAVKERHPAPVESLWEPFEAYFDRVIEMSPYFNEKIDIRVGFDIDGPGGGRWAVDFRDGKSGVFSDFGDPQYIYRFESRWLPPLLSGNVPWEDFFLSCRFSAWRSPDVYNDHLLGLLKFAWPESLDAVESFETRDRSEDRIRIRSAEGVDYEVERYCPHAGQDLAETGEVDHGSILRCLGHHYEFDLETGECVNGRCRPLQSRRLADN